ncbi:hypothetical protein BJP25_05920 [Actinokineospora bangkokensis]|uniref:EamA domain-containing protein n=2 Tax=Actinokineospora bangkokensis TaxID=1193682 RepID=A0A1Q9LC77_9PSEU|nr:hypothetical protein BJP25_05920 [Actinokineospora bangkokensis]
MWGSTYFWIKEALGGLSPSQFSFLRVLVGAVAMLAVVVIAGAALPRSPGVWLRLLLIGFLTNALPVLLVQVVPDATGADVGVVSVFNASVPIWVLLLARPAREPRAGARLVTGVLVGFAGVLLVFPPWEQADRWLTWGSLVNFVAAVAYGLAMIAMRRLMVRAGVRPVVLSATQAFFGVGWAAAVIPVEGWGPAPVWSTPVVVSLLVLGVLNTAVVFTFFTRLVLDEGALRAGTVLYLVPVVLVLGSAWLEGAPLSALHLVGMAVAVVGVAIAWVPARTGAPAPTPRPEPSAIG